MNKFSYLTILVFIGILLTHLHCATTRSEREEIKQFKPIFIDEFKLQYVQNLLRTGYNHSHVIDSLLRQDGGNFTEPLLSVSDHALIDSLVKIDYEKLQLDSIERIGHVSEGSEGKHVLTYVLMKFNSKLLDSLANASYQIWKKNEKAYYRELKKY